MIFDFGRCFYNSDCWSFEAYYRGGKKSEYKKYIGIDKKDRPPELYYISDEDLKKQSCDQYAELKIFLKTESVNIRFYDDEIEQFIKCIRYSLKEKSNYIRYTGEFNDNHIEFKNEVRITGEVDVYNQ